MERREKENGKFEVTKLREKNVFSARSFTRTSSRLES
jgi:hypothetical protein